MAKCILQAEQPTGPQLCRIEIHITSIDFASQTKSVELSVTRRPSADYIQYVTQNNLIELRSPSPPGQETKIIKFAFDNNTQVMGDNSDCLN